MSGVFRWLAWWPQDATLARFRMRGLVNYHSSCCVNTLLQTLSATWELTDLLDRWAAAGVRAAGRNVPLQLKRVLAAMQSDVPQSANHTEFLRCLDAHRIKCGSQHDADEVFLAILNLMQQQMDDQTLALAIQDVYKTKVETHVTCLDCASIQSQTGYLLSLPLHIKEDHNSLEDCMASFFECQELRDVDCCFCAKCGSKTPSRKALRLLSLPPVLCLHLKRFRNRRGFTQKLDCAVTFPETLDLSEILRDAFSADFAQNCCKYTLFAVVVHSGTAHFGHYIAFVRDRRDQRWYCADDSHVSQASWREVQSAYGGCRRKTAYMLMYRRGSKEEAQRPESSG